MRIRQEQKNEILQLESQSQKKVIKKEITKVIKFEIKSKKITSKEKKNNGLVWVKIWI